MKDNMARWRQAQRKKAKAGSQTTGSSKGENCHASALDKFMAKHSRSYKHPLYANWCRKCDKLNGLRR